MQLPIQLLGEACPAERACSTNQQFEPGSLRPNGRTGGGKGTRIHASISEFDRLLRSETDLSIDEIAAVSRSEAIAVRPVLVDAPAAIGPIAEDLIAEQVAFQAPREVRDFDVRGIR